MKRNRIIYWTSTGTVAFGMLFSIYKIFSLDYDHLGFPPYFRIELGILKVLGLIVFLVPQFPIRVKEWAYAGFAIVFISASVANFNSGDSSIKAIEPWFFLILLALSNIYLHKLQKV